MYDDDDDFEIKTRARKKYNIANTINVLRERYIARGRFGSFENELRKRSYYWTTLRDYYNELLCESAALRDNPHERLYYYY